MKKKIEIASWPRRSHYEYFRTFDCPSFSITSPVRVDALYRYAKQEGISFFILCLFVLLKALNRVPQLRQRVEEGEVWEYESVNALVPVLAADGEFTQILVEYRMELPDFLEHAVPLVQAAKLAPAQAACRGFHSHRWPAPTGCSGINTFPLSIGGRWRRMLPAGW